jgi:hypothetical protein
MTRRSLVAAGALALALPLAAGEPIVLKPGPKTVAWGYYDASTPPVLRVKSGDVVEIHTLITSSPARLEAAGLPPGDVETFVGKPLFSSLRFWPFRVPV